MNDDPFIPVIIGILIFLVILAIFSGKKKPCWHDDCDRDGVKAVSVCEEHYEEGAK